MSWHAAVTVAGWSGTVGLLVGYALVSSGRLTGDGLGYQVANVFGSIGLGAAAFTGRVWSSVALNGVWVLIGLIALNRLRTHPNPNLNPNPPVIMHARTCPDAQPGACVHDHERGVGVGVMARG